MSREYQTGATLEVRGETWTLARVQPFDACAVLTLEGRDRSNAGDRLQVIEPFDRPRLVANRKLRRRRRQAVIAAALTAIASARDRSGLWTAASASIDLWPYQLEPALAVIQRRDAPAARRRRRPRQDHSGRVDPVGAARARLGRTRADRVSGRPARHVGARAARSIRHRRNGARSGHRSPNASPRCRRASVPGRGTPSRSRRSISSSGRRCCRRSTGSRSIS